MTLVLDPGRSSYDEVAEAVREFVEVDYPATT